jgi:iron complex transport system ATP-binding protein
LSGGEKQWVQLARVLVQIGDPIINDTPRWLLLDEPVSALDIWHQLVVMDIARNFANAGGGVVAILHNLNLAAMYSDQITLMKLGKVIASGASASVLTNDNLFDAYACRVQIGVAPADSNDWLLPQSVRRDSAGFELLASSL